MRQGTCVPAFREREAAGVPFRASQCGPIDGSGFDELVRAHVGDDRIIRLVNALAGYLGDGSERLCCAQLVYEPARTKVQLGRHLLWLPSVCCLIHRKAPTGLRCLDQTPLKGSSYDRLASHIVRTARLQSGA
jgi:hypothetical protein